jgi:hypothetical protein
VINQLRKDGIYREKLYEGVEEFIDFVKMLGMEFCIFAGASVYGQEDRLKRLRLYGKILHVYSRRPYQGQGRIQQERPKNIYKPERHDGIE